MVVFEVTSLVGVVKGFTLNGVCYAPVKDNECETCAMIGGYCGHCSGINFSPVTIISDEDIPSSE